MPESLATDALVTIFTELTDGSQRASASVLNPEDPGLLRSLDKLSAKDASQPPSGGGASIAAHVDHLCYGFGLLNRWSQGEQPFADADWTASWKRGTVTESEWATLRKMLRDRLHAWRDALPMARGMNATEQNGIVGSVAHLAYHFGAIRQINRSIRGPSAEQSLQSQVNPQQVG